MTSVDTELKELNICDQLRGNSSFMKIMATLFHYGNQAMNAAQLVIAVRALDLLPLRGETPKSTIQGIISTSRKAARDLKQPDPFHIEKDSSGRQAKYSISETVLNGVTLPPPQEIPDEPIILKPVHHASSAYVSSYSQLGKRQRKSPKFYTPEALRKAKNRRRTKSSKMKRKQSAYGEDASESNGSDVEVDTDDDLEFMSTASSDDEDESQTNTQPEEDTINGYSLLYAPPTADMDYIDKINFEEYPIAAYFGIAQQKGYSYPRFRSHEKVKIPKVHCEDKFRVSDILSGTTKKVVGRMFILADGHGGPGCSEFFVRKTPPVIQKLCEDFDPQNFDDKDVQKRFEKGIKEVVEKLDEEYLDIKRVQLGRHQAAAASNGPATEPVGEQADNVTDGTEADNDGCTLIINIFFGNWLVNVNVGDSRSVLISAPDPSAAPEKTAAELQNQPLICGLDNDYKMDVVFASQDHKPYLEHLAREILENGGEFVDSVQDRVIKVDLDKLREDGNRQAKRVALKNARIRPKTTNHTNNNNNEMEDTAQGFAAQSAVRTTANNHQQEQPTAPPVYNNNNRGRSREDRVPSLNVARSCGDLDFKMDPEKKIISCEPDVTFIRISDDGSQDANTPESSGRTVLTSGIHKTKRRHFLFMSTDGMFDYMYEETPERQNRAIAKVIGPMIEDGEKVGGLMLDEEEKSGGQTIDHSKPDENENGEDKKANEMETETQKDKTKEEQSTTTSGPMEVDSEGTANTSKEGEGEKKTEEQQGSDQVPRAPLLFRELNEQETRARKIRERTLVMAARYFANRESVHGFFASTLQDYDDCTIMLIEI